MTPKDFNHIGATCLPGLLGVEIIEVNGPSVTAEMNVTSNIMAPNGFLHAGSVISLADTAAGYGCMANLPDGAHSFTTVEIKSNHLGTAREGRIQAIAHLVHGGKTTQVWDVTVTNKANDKKIALFRCTQMILYPK